MTPARAKAFAIVALLACSSLASAQFTYRPGQEYRSLNTDFYEIAIQKNGRLDVTLSGGQPVFVNAFPMVRFDGDDKPEPLKIDGRYSQRYQVQDALGVGSGMLIRIKNCEWSLRAYPGKPFLAVQVAYVNDTKKPVTVAELLPWCVGDPREGAVVLGAETRAAKVLADTMGVQPARITQAPATSDTHIALVNPEAGRSLIAGFLTEDVTRTTIDITPATKKDEDVFNRMRATCVFDPPVVVEPGDRLDSEVLYLSIAEGDALIGLERYARAFAVASRLPRAPAPPHGWVAHGGTETSGVPATELAVLTSALEPSGYTLVAATTNARGDALQQRLESAIATGGLHEAARRYYLAPEISSPTPKPIRIHHSSGAMPLPKLRAQLTARALLAGAIQFTDPPSTLAVEHRDALRRVLPVLERPARPLDYFTAETPRIWSVPINTTAGQWHVVALFNWSPSEAETTTIPFRALGLNPNEYYTVYDFWEQQYHGTARGQLEVTAAPESVRVFGFRRYLDRPMFLATNSHFTQGATDISSLQWNAQTKRLEGTLDAIESIPYKLQILVPEPFELNEVESSIAEVETTQNERVLTIELTSPRTEPVTWSLQF